MNSTNIFVLENFNLPANTILGILRIGGTGATTWAFKEDSNKFVFDFAINRSNLVGFNINMQNGFSAKLWDYV